MVALMFARFPHLSEGDSDRQADKPRRLDWHSLLAKLEAGRAKTGGLAAGLDDLPLFAAAAQIEEEQCDAIRAEVEKLDVDALSPREALDALYKLKALAREG